MRTNSVDRHGPKPIHRSGHPEFVELVAEDPLLSLEHGQRLFAEGDVPTCMYIVKTGQLQIRSGGVTYEDVGPGGIIGEMGVIETQELRSASSRSMTRALPS
jgi:CRP-like cAMP-binding protein